jgi:hypothetical protein
MDVGERLPDVEDALGRTQVRHHIVAADAPWQGMVQIGHVIGRAQMAACDATQRLAVHPQVLSTEFENSGVSRQRQAQRETAQPLDVQRSD